MRVDLFGVGTKSTSPAITAQKRINCYVERRVEQDRTQFALVGRPGRKPFVTSLGSGSTRGLWAVNTLATPLLFDVVGMGLYSIDTGGNTSFIAALNTSSGDVSMADDGTFLVIVDGQFGYVYNMSTAAFTVIVDGNFTLTPRTVTWQDLYFIVTSSGSRQFQLSQITPTVDPTVWPSIQINFFGSSAGSLRAGIADHSILNLFNDVSSEFWQNTGSPDFPYAQIPGVAAQFGLAAPWSIAQFDNSLVGLFQDRSGAKNVSRLNGFSLKKISDVDIDDILGQPAISSSLADAEGFAFTLGGHPFYVLHSHAASICQVYDGQSNTWSEWQNSDGMHFSGTKYATFNGQLLVGNHDNSFIDTFDPDTYTDEDQTMPFEVISKHIWNDDKYIGIQQLQVDIESGVGTAGGQGENPVIDLQVSKDGGNSFTSVGYTKMGKVGEYTTRVMWSSLGSARDWVLKARITDPVKRVITGARAEIQGASF